MEQPVTRKDKEITGHGWLDYWIMYGTSVFLIELKHAWNAIKTDTVKNSALQSWVEAQSQLKKIGRDDVKSLSINAQSVVKIALMVVPFYQSSTREEKLQSIAKEDMKEIFLEMFHGLKPRPDWACCWLIHEELQEPQPYANRFEIYPGVGIYATVKSV